MPKALITGIDGQDGSYLTEFLLARNYDVAGISRPGIDLVNIGPHLDGISLHSVELVDSAAVDSVVASEKPDEIYHLAAPSVVAVSREDERLVLEAIVSATHTLLASAVSHVPHCRFFLAGSSEMFGQVDKAPQDESTPFRPRSFYGAAKVSAYHLMRYYRQQSGLFAAAGLLYNHESPRRSDAFVTRKITKAAARIAKGQQQELRLGDLEARRDWGYAPDYVEAMWRLLQAPDPRDFVVATGQLHSVREFTDVAFAHVGLDAADFVAVDPALVRAPEAVPLVGDATAIAQSVGWRPRTPFEDIVKEMVEHDLAEIA